MRRDMEEKSSPWYSNIASSLFSASTSRGRPSHVVNREDPMERLDSRAALDSFSAHWAQAWRVMNLKVFNDVTADDVTEIVNHIDQMVTLLVREHETLDSRDRHAVSKTSQNASPLLDHLFIESVLDKILNWSKMCGNWEQVMHLEQLKIYELLMSQICRNNALFQQPLVRPLLSLLSRFVDISSPLEVEKRLVVLLNTLCICLSQNMDLLELFFQTDSFASSHEEPRFLIMTLLIPYVHREGPIGQQARDALLICMRLSRRNDIIAIYVTEQSNFCPLLATGLSGLYSSLPRRLSNGAVLSDDWHQITPEDIKENSDLMNILESLEFCNAVTQMSHPLIQNQFLDYVFNGFLVPVIAPALHQEVIDVPLSLLEKLPKYSNTLEEIIATTSYFDLFIRNITEPNLLQVFLKFICTEKYENQKILDTLITRLNAHSRLSLVTFVLFRTLLELNCEDLLLEIVFKHLISGTYLVGGRDHHIYSIRDISSYSFSAQKFLSLIPTCCYSSYYSETVEGFCLIPDNTDNVSQSSNGSDFVALNANEIRFMLQNYLDYLKDAHIVVLNCMKATRSWSDAYDFGSKVLDNEVNENISANNNVLPHLNGSQSEIEINCSTIGSFLDTLLTRLESLCENNVYTNLQLTGLLSRLALYPQPLLRSFLFNSNLVFRSDVKTLWTVLSNLKNKIDAYASQILNFDELLRKGRTFFQTRDERLLADKKTKSFGNYHDSGITKDRRGSITSIKSEAIDGTPKRNRFALKVISMAKGIRRPSNASSQSSVTRPMLESVPSGQGYIYVNSRPIDESLVNNDAEENSRIQKIVLATIVFEEFLRELSAISYEHFILENIDTPDLQSASDIKPK